MKTTEYEKLRESLEWFKKTNGINYLSVKHDGLIVACLEKTYCSWVVRNGNGKQLKTNLPNDMFDEVTIWKKLLELSRESDLTIMSQSARCILGKGSSAESILVSRDIEA